MTEQEQKRQDRVERFFQEKRQFSHRPMPVAKFNADIQGFIEDLRRDFGDNELTWRLQAVQFSLLEAKTEKDFHDKINKLFDAEQKLVRYYVQYGGQHGIWSVLADLISVRVEATERHRVLIPNLK